MVIRSNAVACTDDRKTITKFTNRSSQTLAAVNQLPTTHRSKFCPDMCNIYLPDLCNIYLFQTEKHCLVFFRVDAFNRQGTTHPPACC